jgi:hypothetical protein
MSLKSTQYILNCVNLISVLLLSEIKKTPFKLNKKAIEALGIPYEFVREILVKQKRSLITEQFIQENNGVIKLHIESWASNLPGHLKNAVTKFNEEDLVKEHLGGMFFETNYVRKALETQPEYSERFIVRQGFDRHQVKSAFKNESDVDLILFDKKLNHYYFLQVKYALEGNTPYFNGAVKRLQSDLASGIKQLSEAKRLLECGQLKDTLKSKGFDYPANTNCSFILLHNLPDYDYQCTEYDIAMYDWNSFRNLILDFRMVVSSEKHSKEIRGDYLAPLCKPDTVIDSFFSSHPVFKGKERQVFLVESSRLEIELEKELVIVEGIGL